MNIVIKYETLCDNGKQLAKVLLIYQPYSGISINNFILSKRRVNHFRTYNSPHPTRLKKLKGGRICILIS